MNICSQVRAICVQIAYHSNLEASSLSGDFKNEGFHRRAHTHTLFDRCIQAIIHQCTALDCSANGKNAGSVNLKVLEQRFEVATKLRSAAAL